MGLHLDEDTMKSQRGFSLIELIVAMGILAAILGYVMAGVSDIQKKASTDINRLGVSQEARQFMDQILRDLRQSGFPNWRSVDPTSPALTSSTDCTQDNTVACGSGSNYGYNGIVSFTSTAIQFEGDVDGSGVSEVYLQEVVPAGGCPCKVQRGTVAKGAGLPTYYTELDDVMNQSVFTAFKLDGTQWVPGTDTDAELIASIGITLYVQSPLPTEGVNGTTYPTATLVGTARVNY
jgi:prepilin-type N-terminal cleavage/methylation domain-containing protein